MHTPRLPEFTASCNAEHTPHHLHYWNMPVTVVVGGPGQDQTAASVTETEGGPAELESTSSQRDSENYFLATVGAKVFFLSLQLKGRTPKNSKIRWMGIFVKANCSISPSKSKWCEQNVQTCIGDVPFDVEKWCKQQHIDGGSLCSGKGLTWRMSRRKTWKVALFRVLKISALCEFSVHDSAWKLPKIVENS